MLSAKTTDTFWWYKHHPVKLFSLLLLFELIVFLKYADLAGMELFIPL